MGRSTRPGSPIFNSEAHVIPDGAVIYVPGAHIRNAYWMQALHGQGALHIPLGDDGQLSGDHVFPTMVASLLPAGLRGLVVGALLAALMSSLSSLFNSSASLFTVDIYEKLRPAASEEHLVRVGRLATGGVVVLGMLWIPVMPLISQKGLYHYLQNVQGFLAPPITAVFLLGLFSRRINARGAV